MPVDVRKLIESGVHFGHQKSRWCPKMKYYIWGVRNDTHLIDISKTAAQIEKTMIFLQDVVKGGKQILFLGTKKAAQDIVKKAAQETNMPYVNHRWIGGTFSNNSQVRKSLTKLLHLEDVLARAKDVQFYTKKELNIFQKMVARLERYVGGLRNFIFSELGAIVVVDVARENSAVLEAASMKIPIVALVDTNIDPSLIDYVIPANDDSPQSINIIFEYLVDAVQKGLQERADLKEAQKKASAEKKIIETQKESSAHAKTSSHAEILTDKSTDELHDKSAENNTAQDEIDHDTVVASSFAKNEEAAGEGENNLSKKLRPQKPTKPAVIRKPVAARPTGSGTRKKSN